jgi:hypothetical protein
MDTGSATKSAREVDAQELNKLYREGRVLQDELSTLRTYQDVVPDADERQIARWEKKVKAELESQPEVLAKFQNAPGRAAFTDEIGAAYDSLVYQLEVVASLVSVEEVRSEALAGLRNLYEAGRRLRRSIGYSDNRNERADSRLLFDLRKWEPRVRGALTPWNALYTQFESLPELTEFEPLSIGELYDRVGQEQEILQAAINRLLSAKGGSSDLGTGMGADHPSPMPPTG